MCGIAGIVGLNRIRRSQLVVEMLEQLKHRGPDDNGIESWDECTLGHVRLSIVDIEKGKQPMLSNDRTKCIVFNGEIYGYKQIKKDLVKYYDFRTDCDTEVILALYNQYGVEMLSHLPGMFAFAIWDSVSKRLFCARDRFGEKPFYYAIGDEGEFIFASEIKAILSAKCFTPQIDYEQVNHYLHYCYVYPTRTIYKNIYCIPPSNYLIYENGQVKTDKYWTMPTTNNEIGLREAIDRFEELFDKSISNQIVADVPVGAYLSGGMDSGSVVAQASKYKDKLTTISFGFSQGVNELELARGMSRKYGTNHIEVSDLNYDIAEELLKLNNIFDEPFADPASVPARIIAEEAKKHVSVVLTGDGGDEILGGYDSKYRALAYMMNYVTKDIDSLQSRTDKLINTIGGIRKVARKIGIYDNSPSVRLKEAYYHDLFIRQKALRLAKAGEKNIVKLMHGDKIASDDDLISIGFDCFCDEGYRDYSGYLEWNDLDNAVRYDLISYLPGDGMTKTDRTTMAVSLESRAPFLDYELASFCISLPFRLKVSNREEKIVLKRAMEKKWTKEVKRTIKNGFSPPLDKWMKTSGMEQLKCDYLENKNSKIYSMLDYSCVIKNVINTGKYYSWFGYELLVLALWMEKNC